MEQRLQELLSEYLDSTQYAGEIKDWKKTPETDADPDDEDSYAAPDAAG